MKAASWTRGWSLREKSGSDLIEVEVGVGEAGDRTKLFPVRDEDEALLAPDQAVVRQRLERAIDKPDASASCSWVIGSS